MAVDSRDWVDFCSLFSCDCAHPPPDPFWDVVIGLGCLLLAYAVWALQ
jgi:hypothetical protein